MVMLMKSNKKAQIIVYDFMAGFVIFTVLIVITSMFWFRAMGQVESDRELDLKLNTARQISQILAKTQGNPLRWEVDYVENCIARDCAIGLAIDDNVLSKQKIDAFIELSTGDGYNRTRELLNIGKYDFYFQYRTIEGSLLNYSGKDPSENMSVNIRRIVVVDGEMRAVEFSLH
jgi:hypothetical protein